jgi:hypothetical protein
MGELGGQVKYENKRGQIYYMLCLSLFILGGSLSYDDVIAFGLSQQHPVHVMQNK